MKTVLVTLLGGTLAMALGGAGCGRADASSVAAAGAAAPAGSDSASAPAGPVIDVAEFKATAKFDGKVSKGATASFEIVVSAKSDFHVNPDYPTRFKADADSDSVKYPSPKLDRSKDDKPFVLDKCATDADHSCVMHVTVPFTAQASGAISVGGTLSFGLCNADKCLVEKAPLELPITAQ